jgi:hypothetical protein
MSQRYAQSQGAKRRRPFLLRRKTLRHPRGVPGGDRYGLHIRQKPVVFGAPFQASSAARQPFHSQASFDANTPICHDPRHAARAGRRVRDPWSSRLRCRRCARVPAAPSRSRATCPGDGALEVILVAAHRMKAVLFFPLVFPCVAAACGTVGDNTASTRSAAVGARRPGGLLRLVAGRENEGRVSDFSPFMSQIRRGGALVCVWHSHQNVAACFYKPANGG